MATQGSSERNESIEALVSLALLRQLLSSTTLLQRLPSNYASPALAVYASPAPVIVYFSPALAVSYGSPAPAMHAAPAFFVEYISPAPAVSYAAPAPAVCAGPALVVEYGQR